VHDVAPIIIVFNIPDYICSSELPSKPGSRSGFLTYLQGSKSRKILKNE